MKKFRYLKISLFVLANILMIFLIVLLLWENNIFVLKGVRIYNNHFVSTNEIIEKARFDYSKNIFKIDVDKIEQQILTHPMIRKVSVSRYFPSIQS